MALRERGADVVLLARAFLSTERAKQPLGPERFTDHVEALFARLPYAAANLLSLLSGVALIVAMVDVPLYAATVLQKSAVEGGLSSKVPVPPPSLASKFWPTT